MQASKLRSLSGFNLAFLVGIFWLFPVKDSDAASWDCAKSSTVVEIAICADPVLSAADEAMAELYKKAVLKSGKVKLDQIKWLRESRNSCKSAAHNAKGINSCLQSSYASRTALLEIVLDENYIAEAEDVSVDEGAGSDSRSVVQKTGGADEQLPSPVIYQTMFDCAKATEIEALICADETLAAADVALGSLVSKRVGAGTSTTADQFNWLNNVRNRCKTADCLAEVYQQRIDTLERSATQSVEQVPELPDVNSKSVPQGVDRMVDPPAPSLPLTWWQKIKFLFFAIFTVPLSWIIGGRIGNLFQADIIVASSGYGLAEERVKNYLYPYIGNGIGVLVGLIAARALAI